MTSSSESKSCAASSVWCYFLGELADVASVAHT